MKSLFMLALCSVFLTGKSMAWETEETNKTVATVGAHHGSTGFVTFREGLQSANCQYQHLYFDISTDLGKAFYSALIAAKMSDAKVRIGYTPPDTVGLCDLLLVSIQD